MMKKVLLVISFTLCSMELFASFAQTRYTWRKDNGDQKTATSLPFVTSTLGGYTISDLKPVRLRMVLDNHSIEYEPSVQSFSYILTCNGVDLTTDTTTTAPFVLYKSAYINHGESTVEIMGGGEYPYIPGKVITKYSTGSMQVASQARTEMEWCVKPTKYVQPQTSYNFRPKNLDSQFSGESLITTYDIAPKSADSIVNQSFQPQGTKILIKWKTALNKHDHFVLMLSRDNIIYNDIDTIAGGTGTDFKTELAVNIGPGTVYTRFKLYDENGKLSVSKPVQHKLLTHAQLAGFNVKPTNNPDKPKEVQIDFSTSSEYFNDVYQNFTVAASTSKNKGDSSKYIAIKYLAGQPLKHKIATNYTFRDVVLRYDEPRHFVLQYYYNGKKRYSNVITVTIPAPAISMAVTNTADPQQNFSIYPNPSNSGKVSFDLKGYKGKTVTATLTNLYGKQISKETFSVSSSENYILSTTAASGTYVLNVTGDGVTKTGKILMQ